MDQFGFGHASGGNWNAATSACIAQLVLPASANLGFVYVTDGLAGDLEKITEFLVKETAIEDWIGTTGIGVCATGREYFDELAVAVMVGNFPTNSYNVFDSSTDDTSNFVTQSDPLAKRKEVSFGVVHADPRNPEIMRQVTKFAEETGCFLAGGLASSRGTYAQVAGLVTEGALTGAIFSSEVPVVTALTQGCSPIGPIHEVTQCQDNIAIEIDGRKSLDVLKDDIGEVLAKDLKRISGYIFCAFPVSGSDRADYMVRNLVGLDEELGLLAIGVPIEIGQKIIFCRRDSQTAHDDLTRMLLDLKRRATAPIKGAVYFTCLGRGPNMFGGQSGELAAIQNEIGDVPLVGFFCNGEISHNRVYSYTGVLSLFL